MNKLSISLRPRCNRRQSLHHIPMKGDQVYSYEDFTSRHFVDKLLRDYHHTKSDIEPKVHSAQLLSTLDAITQKFDYAIQHINSLKQKCIIKATALCTGENRQYELNHIEQEMRRCHAAIARNGTDSLLVDEFATLVNRYKISRQKGEMAMTQGTVSEFLKCMGRETDKFINVYEEMVSGLQYEPILVQKPSLNAEKPRYDDQIISLKDGSLCGITVFVFKWCSVDHLLYVAYKSQDKRKGRCEIKNLKNGKSCRLFELKDQQIESHVPSRNRPSRIVVSQNLVFIPTYKANTLDIFRLTSRRIPLVAKISIENLFSQSADYGEFLFDVIDDMNALMVAQSQEMALVDLRSRRILWQHSDRNYIDSMTYNKKIERLAIGSRREVNLYKVDTAKCHITFERKVCLIEKTQDYDLISLHPFLNSFIGVQSRYEDGYTLHRILYSFDGVKIDSLVLLANKSIFCVAGNRINISDVFLEEPYSLRILTPSSDKLNASDVWKRSSMLNLFQDETRTIFHDPDKNTLSVVNT